MVATIVETRYGKIQGVQVGNVTVWRGIRYAKPPLGELRFRPPQPPDRWDGIADATQFGPVAYQVRNPLFETETVALSEDCLRLNVWSPGADDKRRPVMVFIHGGSFRGGSGQQRVYDGSSFASVGDVVLVTVNYRLGPLGFLYLGDMAGEAYASSGNCGLLDQVAALQWVRENIAAFGGDPDRVTLFGESAGSLSVSALLCMPAAKGLFQRAILQSGVLLGALSMIDAAFAADVTRRVLASLDVAPDNFEALVNMPAEDLIEKTQDIGLWMPVVDGVSVPVSLMEAIKTGTLHDVPLIVGSNLYELAFYFHRDPDWSALADESRRSRLNRPLGPFPAMGPFPAPIEQHYIEGKKGEELQNGLIKLATFIVFSGPVQLFVETVANHSPLWVYRFDWGNGPWKASHAFELAFVFNTTDHPMTELEGEPDDISTMADRMHRTWIAFAHHGDPNNETIPHWPSYQHFNRPTMVLDTVNRLEDDPFAEERRVWGMMAQH